MADQLEGARTLPVKFKDQGDGSVAENIAIVGVVLVESSSALTTSISYFSTADGRNGLSSSYVEQRASDSKSRTITITRDTSTGAITAQSAGAWA